MKLKLIFLLFISVWCNLLFSQNYTLQTLLNNTWEFEAVNEFELGEYKEIGLHKLNYKIDSSRTNFSKWTFTENKIIIENNALNDKVEIIELMYTINPKNNKMSVFHTSQGSIIWEYNLGIVSNGNFILMSRLKTKN